MVLVLRKFFELKVSYSGEKYVILRFTMNTVRSFSIEKAKAARFSITKSFVQQIVNRGFELIIF